MQSSKTPKLKDPDYQLSQVSRKWTLDDFHLLSFCLQIEQQHLDADVDKQFVIMESLLDQLQETNTSPSGREKDTVVSDAEVKETKTAGTLEEDDTSIPDLSDTTLDHPTVRAARQPPTEAMIARFLQMRKGVDPAPIV